MPMPLQITIRDIPHSDAVEERIRKKAEKLEVLCDQIIACHVVVEQTQRHKQQGKLHNVRIDLTIPGKELVVTHNEQEDLYAAIRDAFSNVQRQLEETLRKQHGEVKTHPDLLQGRIVRLFQESDFGFIATPNGDEFYFNASHVTHPKFSRLKEGVEVSFTEGMGADGPQAHRVRAKSE